MRSTLALSAVLSLCACGALDSRLPDGGRSRMHCTNKPNEFPVKVLDRAGAPAEGATVTATNATDGRHASGLTNAQGVFSVTEEVGPGTVKVSSELNGLLSNEGNFNFTCGECDCACSPRELILKLQ